MKTLLFLIVQMLQAIVNAPQPVVSTTPTFIQGPSTTLNNCVSVNSCAQALASNVTSGDTLIVLCANGGSGLLQTPTDTLTSTWTAAPCVPNGGGLTCSGSTAEGFYPEAIFYTHLTSSGADTVTCHSNQVSGTMTAIPIEVSNILAASPIDSGAFYKGNATTTTPNAGAVTSSSTGSYIACFVLDQILNSTFTSSGGVTQRYQGSAGVGAASTAFSDNVPAGTFSNTPAWNASVPGNYDGMCVALKHA